jgi:N-acetylglucosamine-6-phosphate deacetylase
MTEKSFMLQGQPIRVEDGVCVNVDGTLAGSDLDMAGAVRNAVKMLGVGLETALRMASRHPAAFLGLDERLGRIAPGLAANLVALDDRLNVVRSWIDGVDSEPA